MLGVIPPVNRMPQAPCRGLLRSALVAGCDVYARKQLRGKHDSRADGL